MKKITMAIGTILLASTAVVMTSATPAAAFRGGGGGHGFGGGGGHGFGGGGGHGFGGGGGHGFGGGGGHGFGGGGHFGGIGGHGIGGFGGHGFGGHGFGGHGFGGHGFGGHGIAGHGIAGHGIAGHGIAAHGIAGHGIAGHGIAGHGIGGRNGLHATRMAHGFGHDRFGHDGHWHNGFWHNGHGFDRFGGVGWVGPVFWPYAFSDFSCGLWWGYWGGGCADPYWGLAFGDPFWGYGYNDIYDGLFSPFAFTDLAPYLAGEPNSAQVARSRRGPSPAGAVAQMCGDDTKEVAAWPIDRIRQLVSPNDQQRQALDDLADASTRAAGIIKSGCSSSVALTPSGRLEAMEQRLEAMKQAVQTVSSPLDKFYDALTDEQKAKFSVANEPPVRRSGRHHEQAGGPMQGCTEANSATQWPEARIEAALRPTEAQLAKLKALQSATARAVERLAASCPSEMPVTPPARLAAISKRLDVMLTEVKNVRGALDDLYAALTDEQKLQFDRIGQAQHTAERQG